MPQDWDIKPRSAGCRACEEPFDDGQAYFSSLVFGKEGYTRSDYCEACWAQSAESAEPYSVWQGVFRLPPPPPEEALKKETAESLLRRLMAENPPRHAKAVYILAVMLERKRVLVERDVRVHDDGHMVRVYEHRKTGDTFVVRDPRLTLDQLEAVQQEVITLLGQAEPKPPAEPETPPPAAAPAPPAREGFYSKDAAEEAE